MIGKIKFKRGQRVKLSDDAFAAHLYPKTKMAGLRGVVVTVDGMNFPSVLWDGRKHHDKLHPHFVVLEASS